MTNPAEVDRILDSGILTTDLLQLQNVNASFEIYLADTEEGGPLKNGGDNVSTGHSGVRGVNTSLSSSTVTIGKQKYSIREDGKVTDAKGKAVTDKNQVSQIMLKNSIINNLINPYKNSNLYIGTYSDGTEFGNGWKFYYCW